MEVRQSEGQLRSQRYRIKTFSIKEPRFLVIVASLKYTRDREYKSFDSTKFFENLQVRLTHLDMNSLDFGSLKKCFMELLNKVAFAKN